MKIRMTLRPRVSTKSCAFSMLSPSLFCCLDDGKEPASYHLFVLGYSVTRAAKTTGFCAPTARNKRDLFESGNLKEIFFRKQGSGRKSACASKQDEITEELESKD